jgi:hypothetical protein
MFGDPKDERSKEHSTCSKTVAEAKARKQKPCLKRERNRSRAAISHQKKPAWRFFF